MPPSATPRRPSSVASRIERPPTPQIDHDVPDDDLFAADVLAVGVSLPGGGAQAQPQVTLDRLAALAALRYGVDLSRVLAQENVTGQAGAVLRVPVVAPPGCPARLLLVGTGTAGPHDLRRAGAALARATRGDAVVATSLAQGLPADGAAARALVEGLVLGWYTVPQKDQASAHQVFRLSGKGRPRPRVAQALRHGLLGAAATVRARDLAVTPANVKTPQWLAARAQEIARSAGLGFEVWDESRLAAEGFGGLLAVGAGSPSPPRFVRLDYVPAAASRPPGSRGRSKARSGRPVVLVGKGITFDTGGLSIKPRAAMTAMKTDMSGAGAVLAVLAACADLGVRRAVTGLLPLAENAVSGSAYRPSDVVRHYGGRTVEVANTDAEGRMVLADALAYADAVLDPSVVVDIATLTGAAGVGLGRRHAALFSTDEHVAAGLEAAGEASGERVWRMPLVADYETALESSVADLRQVPADARVGGGAITAALFLRRFAGDRPWAHLDIAGPARADQDEHDVGKGATGYGARLLLRWLEGLA